MKKYFYALCMATALGTVGCSDDEAINYKLYYIRYPQR